MARKRKETHPDTAFKYQVILYKTDQSFAFCDIYANSETEMRQLAVAKAAELTFSTPISTLEVEMSWKTKTKT